MATFTDLVESWSNTDMKAERAAAFFGVLVGVTADTAQEVWTLCCRMHLLDDPESPDDALPFLARDRRLDRYPLETPAQHRQRLIDAWETYALGGSETNINEQLRAAGYGPTTRSPAWGEPGLPWGGTGYAWGDLGTYIQFRPQELGPRGEPAPYWSQFWVVFAPGFHPVVGPPIPWGTFVWGDTYDGVWGPLGYSQEFKRTIAGIIRKWKPSRYVCRGFLFKLGTLDVAWGYPGHAWGTAGLIWGGGIEVPLPLS
jgi:Phage tail protein (Tail_P2_I)